MLEYMKTLEGTTSVEAADKDGWVVSVTPAVDGFLHALQDIQALA